MTWATRMRDTIRRGTGVSCLPNHDPLMLAQRIAQLDQLARGRFLWGVGSGGFPGDFELFGFDPKTGEHREATRAILDLVLELWKDPKPGLYESKHWRFPAPQPHADIPLQLPPPPFPRPPPPIPVAGPPGRSAAAGLPGERGSIPLSVNFSR